MITIDVDTRIIPTASVPARFASTTPVNRGRRIKIEDLPFVEACTIDEDSINVPGVLESLLGLDTRSEVPAELVEFATGQLSLDSVDTYTAETRYSFDELETSGIWSESLLWINDPEGVERKLIEWLMQH